MLSCPKRNSYSPNVILSGTERSEVKSKNLLPRTHSTGLYFYEFLYIFILTNSAIGTGLEK